MELSKGCFQDRMTLYITIDKLLVSESNSGTEGDLEKVLETLLYQFVQA